MRRTAKGVIVATMVAAAGITVYGSSHREALAILNEPCADNTDTFAWVSNQTHDTLNLMSLGGLAVAIGLIIDDTVVVIENIARHLAEGQSGDAAVDQARLADRGSWLQQDQRVSRQMRERMLEHLQHRGFAGGERCGPVTAIARRLPLRTKPISVGMGAMCNATWPPTRSFKAGPVPR